MNILTPIGSTETKKEDEDQVIIADDTATVNVAHGDPDADHEDGLILRETYMKEFNGTGRKGRRHSRSSTSPSRVKSMTAGAAAVVTTSTTTSPNN